MRTALLLLMFFALAACQKTDDAAVVSTPSLALRVFKPFASIHTDKACYKPNEKVVFNLSIDTTAVGTLKIQYLHVGSVVEEKTIALASSDISWEWTPPATDFKAYLVVVVAVNGKDTIRQGTTAVDVSSDWTRFPRYGFLSAFSSQVNDNSIKATVENLKNFHINGIQFYDWQNKHHWPLKMNGAVAADSWVDIANREIQLSVLKKYIANNKSMGISSMFYNLLYGTWKDALADGVPADWYLYNNAAATDINKHPLSGWLSDIFLVNPGLKAWQDYLGQKTADVYQNLDFDGFHIDQLGDRGTLYSKQGTPVDLSQQFGSFIAAMKTKFPNKKLAMNAVNQYGQAGILSSPVDFAYTEVWSPNDSYSSLANIILNNYTTSPKLNTVIAAYMDYAKADQKGTFNEAGVLLTDAVLFAFGGSHIELGEHMLGKEYFPNNNLSMSASLKSKLTNYYDFLVGYQNILRDGGKLNYNPSVTSTDKILPWPGTSGYVTTFRRLLTSGTEVFHFINFRDANSMDWRDTNGTQIEPSVIRNYNLVINLTGAPKKVWAASPDVNGGAPIQVPFVQNGNTITLKLPYLKYWSMLVVEH